MKRFFSISLILLSFVILGNSHTFYGTTDVKTFREGRDKELRNIEESPLKEEDFPNFKGLFYFEIDNKYRVTAKFMKTTDEKYFLMPTSAGKSQKYIKYAVLDFKINNKNHSLNVYHVEEAVRENIPNIKTFCLFPLRI